MDKKIKELAPKIVPILKKYGADKAGIFGSYARGEAKKGSDIDILVGLKKQVGLFEFSEIIINLEDKLKIKVDLVEYGALRPEIKKVVLEEQVRII